MCPVILSKIMISFLMKSSILRLLVRLDTPPMITISFSLMGATIWFLSLISDLLLSGNWIRVQVAILLYRRDVARICSIEL